MRWIRNHGLSPAFLALLLLSVGLLDCGSGPPPVNIAGNWTGTISDDATSPPTQGSATLSLTEGGSGGLTGRINLTIGGPFSCFEQNQSLSGSVKGTQVNLSSGTDLSLVTVQATVDSGALHLNGTFQWAEPGVGCGASGSISLTKQ